MKTNSRLLVGVILILLPYFYLNAQPYLGGDGSGHELNQLFSCSASWMAFESSASGGSGADSAGFFICSDFIKHTSSGIGSGFTSEKNYYCDTLNQRLPSHGDSSSGANFNKITYCIPLASIGDSMSGAFFNTISYCTRPFAIGDSASGAYVNKINYCIPYPFNGESASGHGRSIGTCLIPLPVKILDFQAVKNDHSALLYWYVTEELNTNYYQIVKSINGTDFYPLTEVKAKNEPLQTLYYSANDPNPVLGLNYYQLLAIDYDGNTSFSDIKVLDFSDYQENAPAFVVYPNPVFNQQDLTVFNFSKQDATLELTDLLGKTLYQSPLQYADNPSPHKITTNMLAKGIYFLRLQTPSKTFFQKILVY